MKILITDPVHPSAFELLTAAGFAIDELEEKSKENLSEYIVKYDVIICRTSTTIDKKVFERAKNLKCIALASTGFDRIDLEEAKKRGIAVLGLPAFNKDIDPEKDGNFVSTAEHAVLLILGALDNIYQATHSIKQGRWEKKFLVGNELANKTVGFFGFGRIATLVARRLKPFNVSLIAYDPYANTELVQDCNVELVSFEELCKQSDIITIHAPKTPETIGKFNQKAFENMKDGVFIVNTARSAIIEDAALIEALQNGKVCRAALDVFNEEPHGINYDLICLPNVIATPHIGGSTHEAWKRISENAAKNVIDFFNGVTKNQINL